MDRMHVLKGAEKLKKFMDTASLPNSLSKSSGNQNEVEMIKEFSKRDQSKELLRGCTK